MGAGAVALWVVLPPLGRALDMFPVRRVELAGVRHLAPDAVLEALRLPDRASLFADRGLLADRLRGLAGVADARVSRRWLSGTLTITVREVDPVALTPGPNGARALVAIDGSGRALPFDPARAALDLPIVERADSGIAAVLAVVRAVDPALFGAIGLARTTVGGDVVLEWESRRVLLRRDAGAEEIRAVVLVAQDLAARARRYAELDARYGGQVVVRRRPQA
jgi:cell division septal protein FtsQ